MDIPTKVERQHIYLAHRELFSGNNAFVRDKKVILSMIKASGTGILSTNKHLKRKTVPILRSLLSDRVFELEERARKEFPELWPKSRDQTLRETSISTAKLEEPGRHKSLDVSALRPSQHAQHYVMTTVQRILEASCFNFTKTWLPSVLEERSWSCAAALELTCWIHLMKEDIDNLPDACIDKEGRTLFKQISGSLSRLRHAAVHRLHLGSDEFLAHVRSAHMLTEILRDRDSASKLGTLYNCIEDMVSKTRHSINAVQKEVNDSSVAIQKQREALDEQERQLERSAERQSSRIIEAADQSLVRCIDNLTSVRGWEGGSDKNIFQSSCTGNLNCDVQVDEDDIESDEDQLRADLK